MSEQFILKLTLTHVTVHVAPLPLTLPRHHQTPTSRREGSEILVKACVTVYLIVQMAVSLLLVLFGGRKYESAYSTGTIPGGDAILRSLRLNSGGIRRTDYVRLQTP